MSRRDEWRKRALASIDAAREDLLAISHDIFEYAEVAFEEFRSAERLWHFLRERGYRISDVEGLPTAFVA
ncbi:MAG TPA: hypothetical protein PK300_09945, partial [Bacillota bacterium]|nr:hypothetical protein [Bacillota bacterium]